MDGCMNVSRHGYLVVMLQRTGSFRREAGESQYELHEGRIP
jgi:hypothetical protein